MRGWSTLLTLSLVLCAGTANAYVITGGQYQPQAVDAAGNLVVEEAIIDVIACNGPGENGGQYLIYRYQQRAGYRAILPPNWGSPIGGRDFASHDEASRIACGTSTGTAPPPATGGCVGFAGTWMDNLFGSLGLTQTGTTVSGLYVNGANAGAFNGTVTGQVLEGTWVGRDGSSGTARMELSADGATYTGTLSTTGFGGNLSGRCVGAPPAS